MSGEEKLNADDLDSTYGEEWITFHCKQVAAVGVAAREAMTAVDATCKMWTYTYPQQPYFRKNGTDWRFLVDLLTELKGSVAPASLAALRRQVAEELGLPPGVDLNNLPAAGVVPDPVVSRTSGSEG